MFLLSTVRFLSMLSSMQVTLMDAPFSGDECLELSPGLILTRNWQFQAPTTPEFRSGSASIRGSVNSEWPLSSQQPTKSISNTVEISAAHFFVILLCKHLHLDCSHTNGVAPQSCGTTSGDFHLFCIQIIDLDAQTSTTRRERKSLCWVC